MIRIVVAFAVFMAAAYGAVAQTCTMPNCTTNNQPIVLNADGSSHTAATVLLTDPGAGIGVPVNFGNTQAGGGFTSFADPSGFPVFFNFTNLGVQSGVLPNGEGSVTVSINSLTAPGTAQVQGMLQFQSAAGNSWMNTQAIIAGTQLGEIGFFGASTHGMTQTETASLWGYADQAFSDPGPTPLDGNTSAGSNLCFKTTANGTGSQQVSGVLNQDGAFWLGRWPCTGNASPFSSRGGEGALVLKDSSGTLASVPGATVLKSYNGALYVRLPGKGGDQPVVVQDGGITPGHHVCWEKFGVVQDCGN